MSNFINIMLFLGRNGFKVAASPLLHTLIKSTLSEVRVQHGLCVPAGLNYNPVHVRCVWTGSVLGDQQGSIAVQSICKK